MPDSRRELQRHDLVWLDAHGWQDALLAPLPAEWLRSALRRGLDRGRALIETMFVLIAHLENTNVLYRGGRAGLLFAQRAAHEFLLSGSVAMDGWEARVRAIRDAFVARNLSPGGTADLLAATCFVHHWSGASE